MEAKIRQITIQEATIIVEDTFAPNEIHFKRGIAARLTFDRLSNESCLDQVQSADLHFKTDLPVNFPETVAIPTDQVGTFSFECGHNHVRGTIVID